MSNSAERKNALVRNKTFLMEALRNIFYPDRQAAQLKGFFMEGKDPGPAQADGPKIPDFIKGGVVSIQNREIALFKVCVTDPNETGLRQYVLYFDNPQPEDPPFEWKVEKNQGDTNNFSVVYTFDYPLPIRWQLERFYSDFSSPWPDTGPRPGEPSLEELMLEAAQRHNQSRNSSSQA